MPWFFVVVNAGMSNHYWSIRAGTAAEILDAIAEVWIIDDGDFTARMSASPRHEWLDLADARDHWWLAKLMRIRDQQRTDPLFGALAGRSANVYTVEGPEGYEEKMLMEVDTDGWLGRSILVEVDATTECSRRRDGGMPRPPEDLRRPDLARNEITSTDFERCWDYATAHGVAPVETLDLLSRVHPTTWV